MIRHEFPGPCNYRNLNSPSLARNWQNCQIFGANKSLYWQKPARTVCLIIVVSEKTQERRNDIFDRIRKEIKRDDKKSSQRKYKESPNVSHDGLPRNGNDTLGRATKHPGITADAHLG